MVSALKTPVEISLAPLPVQHDLDRRQDETLQKIDSIVSRLETPTEGDSYLISIDRLDVKSDNPHFCEANWIERYEKPTLCALSLFFLGVLAALGYAILTAVCDDCFNSEDKGG